MRNCCRMSQLAFICTLALSLGAASYGQQGSFSPYGTVSVLDSTSQPPPPYVTVNGTFIPLTGVDLHTEAPTADAINMELLMTFGAGQGGAQTQNAKLRFLAQGPPNQTRTIWLLIQAQASAYANICGTGHRDASASVAFSDADLSSLGVSAMVSVPSATRAPGTCLTPTDNSGLQSRIISRTISYNGSGQGEIDIPFLLTASGSRTAYKGNLGGSAYVKAAQISIGMKVRRGGTAAAFASSAQVAAGGANSVEHTADVEITVKDGANNPLAGVAIGPPDIEDGDGAVVPGVGAAFITMNNGGVTDVNGKATGVFRSSNLVTGWSMPLDPKPVTLRLDRHQLNGPVTATIHQHWDQLNQWRSGILGLDPYNPYFNIDEPAPITFKPAFRENPLEGVRDSKVSERVGILVDMEECNANHIRPM